MDYKQNEIKEQVKNIIMSIDNDFVDKLIEINSPMLMGLAVLYFVEKNDPNTYLDAESISQALEACGINRNSLSIKRAFANAGEKIKCRRNNGKVTYKIMRKGQKKIEELLATGNLKVVYIEPNTPRTAKRKLKQLISNISGIVKISDPFYGERSFDTLELLADHCTIKFLTSHTSENNGKIQRIYKDFHNEYQNTEIRIYPNRSDLHDRYLLWDDGLILIGHGIKDIGNKESFAIVIKKDLIEDIHKSVENNFDSKWNQSKQL
jgi:hypothetical protein